jgi:hypothetical protein
MLNSYLYRGSSKGIHVPHDIKSVESSTLRTLQISCILNPNKTKYAHSEIPLDQNEIREDMSEVADDSSCISSSWSPYLYVPGTSSPPSRCRCLGDHPPRSFSFIYHWHYAHRLPPGLPRTQCVRRCILQAFRPCHLIDELAHRQHHRHATDGLRELGKL